VEATVLTERDDQRRMFLLDGFCRSPSPVLLLVGVGPAASRVASAFHNGTLPWDDRPARVGRLLELDSVKMAAAPAGNLADLLTELAGTDHWIHVPEVGSLAGTPAGRRVLDGLMAAVRDGGVAAVIASTSHELLPVVRAEAPRLMGFASMVRFPDGSEPGDHTSCRSLVACSLDPADVGWLVAVRYELTGPVGQDVGPADGDAGSALQLLEAIEMITREDGPPFGVIASLKPEAFTASDEDAAFATAALAAERFVGRPLNPGEHVVAARAVFYA
jgi:hypothetical protein